MDEIDAAYAAARRGMVVVVDDDADISQALCAWLELAGLRAARHASGESLLRALHRDVRQLTLHVGVGEPVALPLAAAVLDLNLPGMSGIDLAHALRRLAPNLPLTIVTALTDAERGRYGAPPSDVRCLKKPFELDALEHALFLPHRGNMGARAAAAGG